jgi:hypothetical protein
MVGKGGGQVSVVAGIKVYELASALIGPHRTIADLPTHASPQRPGTPNMGLHSPYPYISNPDGCSRNCTGRRQYVLFPPCDWPTNIGRHGSDEKFEKWVTSKPMAVWVPFLCFCQAKARLSEERIAVTA